MSKCRRNQGLIVIRNALRAAFLELGEGGGVWLSVPQHSHLDLGLA